MPRNKNHFLLTSSRLKVKHLSPILMRKFYTVVGAESKIWERKGTTGEEKASNGKSYANIWGPDCAIFGLSREQTHTIISRRLIRVNWRE